MSTADFSSQIYQLIEQSKTQTRRGNELSILIKARFPDFVPSKYSSVNLRDFIRRYVPAVVEVGRAGADIIYGLRADVSSPKTSEVGNIVTREVTRERFDPKVWKTFVSPSAAYALYGNPETGELRVVAYNV